MARTQQTTRPLSEAKKAQLAAAPAPAATKPKPKPAPKAAAQAGTGGNSVKGKGKAKAVEPESDEDDFNSSESDAESDPGSASDDDDDDSGSDDEEDSPAARQAAMIAALEAHGRAMFGLGPAGAAGDGGSDSDASVGNGTVLESDDDEGFHTDDGWGAGDAFVSDSEEEGAMGAIDAAFQGAKKGKSTSTSMSTSKAKGPGKGKTKETTDADAKPTPAAPKVPEVVFAPTSSSSVSLVSNSEKRAFLKGNSAKMMGIKAEETTSKRGKKRAREAEEAEEDASNLRLDKTLHDMLLTTILPSAEADAASRPVEKRNALSGRLLELASYSLPGEGSSVVRGSSLSSHPVNVRTGLLHAANRRQEKARAEAEAAGSWVKGVGGLGDLGKRGAGIRSTGGNAARGVRTFGLEVGKKKGMDGKKAERARGLSMGVGKYKNGTLTISEREIDRVNNLGKGGVRKKGKRK